jgi:hypothetical protein
MEEYLTLRLATTCVDSFSALNEMAVGVRLPESIMASDHMKKLWTQSNLGVIM